MGLLWSDASDVGDGEVCLTTAGVSSEPEPVYEGDGDCLRNQLSPANRDLVFRTLNQSE